MNISLRVRTHRETSVLPGHLTPERREITLRLTALSASPSNIETLCKASARTILRLALYEEIFNQHLSEAALFAAMKARDNDVTIDKSLRDALRDGTIRLVWVIEQGAVISACRSMFAENTAIDVRASASLADSRVANYLGDFIEVPNVQVDMYAVAQSFLFEHAAKHDMAVRAFVDSTRIPNYQGPARFAGNLRDLSRKIPAAFFERYSSTKASSYIYQIQFPQMPNTDLIDLTAPVKFLTRKQKPEKFLEVAKEMKPLSDRPCSFLFSRLSPILPTTNAIAPPAQPVASSTTNSALLTPVKVNGITADASKKTSGQASASATKPLAPSKTSAPAASSSSTQSSESTKPAGTAKRTSSDAQLPERNKGKDNAAMLREGDMPPFFGMTDLSALPMLAETARNSAQTPGFRPNQVADAERIALQAYGMMLGYALGQGDDARTRLMTLSSGLHEMLFMRARSSK